MTIDTCKHPIPTSLRSLMGQQNLTQIEKDTDCMRNPTESVYPTNVMSYV